MAVLSGTHSDVGGLRDTALPVLVVVDGEREVAFHWLPEGVAEGEVEENILKLSRERETFFFAQLMNPHQLL